MHFERKKEKRILVYGMSDNPGGIETYLLNLLKGTKDMGICLDFVTDFPQIAYRKELTNEGARIYFIPAKSRGLLKQWKALRKILKEHREYETVYFNILNAGAVFTMLMPWIMRKRIIIHSHNGSADNTGLHVLCRPFLTAMGSGFVACSELAAEFMFGKKFIQKKNILYMPNAIETDRYDFQKSVREEVRKELGIEDQFVLCHVGRIVYQKNPKGVVDILKRCRDSFKDVLLLWAGTGDMEQEVKAYAKEQGVSGEIRFLGVRKDIDRIMQASDCFILPSIYEGLPIVAIEAQASGLPCFLSDRISKETKITENVEFLPIEDLESWEKAILQSRAYKRISQKQAIVHAGYDLDHQEKKQKMLIKLLLDEEGKK